MGESARKSAAGGAKLTFRLRLFLLDSSEVPESRSSKLSDLRRSLEARASQLFPVMGLWICQAAHAVT